MTPTRWAEVERVFEEARALPAAERPAFLDRACASDAELRREVESLLKSHQAAGAFLEQPSLFFSADNLEDDRAVAAAGQLIGPYRVVREIGRGGMGAVYLADRADEQYEKQVAIKLIKRGMDTDSVLKRFRNERQILAGFDHPNIARLFDGGTTDGGLPYFVMEYIEGLPIDEYCKAHALSITERLKLFREVCAAVSYAHRHLVVHRDIKRSNILITAEGVPKLLDFGVAKILQEGDGAEARATVTELRPMTPEYASPEQVRGEPITTASDVYSLGVVLYELLTGRLPYRFTSRSPNDVARAIAETEPAKPSTVVADRDSRFEIRDSARPESAVHDSRSLRGDLDNIVLMALRKLPERRYQSVEQFSEDIRRHLEALPVRARKETTGYRAGKFIRRNRVAVAAAALVFLSLFGGIIATTWQAHRARMQEALAKAETARAERRFNDVRQLAHSVLFDYHDAIKDLPGATRVRERLVKDALAYLDSLAAEAGDDPALQRELAAAYERVGDVRGQAYSASLGDGAGAMESYEKALRIREALVAAAPRDVQARRDLAASYKKIGNQIIATDAARGLDQLRKSLALYSKLAAEQTGSAHARHDLAEINNAIGSALEDRGEMVQALEHLRKARAIYEELLAANPKDQTTRRGLSVVYENIGRVSFLSDNTAGALENNGKALALREALVAEEPTNTDYRRILGVSYQNNGDYQAWVKNTAAALESFRKKVAIDEASVAVDPANAQSREDLAYSSQRIGDLLTESEDYAQAIPHYRRALEMYEKDAAAVPQDLGRPLRVATVRARLGKTQARLGSIAPAREECGKAADLLRRKVDDPANAGQQRLRVVAYTELGEAYALLAVEKTAPGLRTEHWRAARDHYRRGFDLMQDLQKRGILNAEEIPELENISRKITECDASLGE